MALLQRTRLLPQQRLDLPDYRNIEDFTCSDFQAIFKNIFTNQNFVMSGFAATGTGTNTLSIALAGSELVVSEDDGTLYVGAPSLAPLTTTALAPAATNYVELIIDLDTGGQDSRAFWDQTANGGEGAEFSQIIDTYSFLQAELAVNTSNFTGDPDKIPICEVDVNGGGIITAIRDSRNLFWRLGRASNPTFSFPWGSRVEPATTSFTGADKDIGNLKAWMDAVMTSFKEVKGSDHWFEAGTVSLTKGFRNAAMSTITALTPNARFSWDGSVLSLTDDNGTPSDSDELAAIRLWDSTVNLRLTRQDGTGGSTTITMADGDVLWVELPDPLAHGTYSGVGVITSTYRVSARGSVPMGDSTYWIAFREGSTLYFRWLGELEAGEEVEINDTTSLDVLTYIGSTGETDVDPNYTSSPSGSLAEPNYNTTNGENLTVRVAKLTAMFADANQDLNLEFDPGSITWDGTNIAISNAQLSLPGATVGAAPISINNLTSTALPANSAVYVDINRTSGSALTTAIATLASLTPQQQRLILVRNIGGSLLIR